MSQTSDYYDARATDAESAAEQADLANVRDRELRSAAVFRQLANQARKIDVSRRNADAERAERRALEAEALGEPGELA